MKYLVYILFLVFTGSGLNAQTVLGEWETTNKEGRVNSIIEIYKKNNEVFGKVVRITKKEDRDKVCTECDGKLKNQPIEGLELMKGMKKDGENEYSGGTIVDPKTGKEYRCRIWLDEDDPNILKVRGYISFLYKTRTWKRAK